MKIVCDNCATKYSIADEKVRGKVFKIRCKKCSHIIVVRGNDGAPSSDAGAADNFPADEPAAARSGGAPHGSNDAVWHLVIDREQVGPLTVPEVRDKFAAGEIDVETYAWREGFADWLRLGSIDDFRDLGAGSTAPQAKGPTKEEGATRRTDTADLFATAAPAEEPTPEAGDLFGGTNSPSHPTGEASMPANDLFGGAAASGGGGSGGLFGAPAAAAPMAAAAPAPRAARASVVQPEAAPMAAASSGGEVKMTGQRNESSVLFSLNNLQALAGGGGGGGGSAGSAANKPAAEAARPGFANSQTEGSGLIDIRAMAASTLASSPSSSSARAEEPSFASAPLFSPMAAPILMPSAPSGPPKWIWALLGVGVLAVIGIVVVGVLLLTKKPEAPVVAAAPAVAPVAAAPLAVAPPAAAVPGAPAAAPATGTPEAAKPAAPEEADKHKKGKGSKGPHAAAPVAAPSAAPAAAAPSEAPAKKPSGGRRDALDDLLNQAAPEKPSARRAAAEPSGGGGADLPEQLDKTAIVGGMSKIKGRVAGCYDQYKVPGLANVSVTIGKSGRVSAANVSGAFSGTPTGECVERAVKSASFPPFKGAAQTINYPFMLR